MHQYMYACQNDSPYLPYPFTQLCINVCALVWSCQHLPAIPNLAPYLSQKIYTHQYVCMSPSPPNLLYLHIVLHRYVCLCFCVPATPLCVCVNVPVTSNLVSKKVRRCTYISTSMHIHMTPHVSPTPLHSCMSTYESLSGFKCISQPPLISSLSMAKRFTYISTCMHVHLTFQVCSTLFE